MISRILVCLFILINFSFAAFETVRIGKIDPFYQNKITEQQLLNMLSEIEVLFESSLNVNVFDYSNDGKPIDILFVPPNKIEERILKKVEKIKQLQSKISKLKVKISDEKLKMIDIKSLFDEKNSIQKEKIRVYNEYVSEINRHKYTKDEYKKVKAKVELKRKKLNSELRVLKSEYRKLSSKIKDYNRKIRAFNRLINRHNRYVLELEALNRGFKKVKGKTFVTIKNKKITTLKDGKSVSEKNITVTLGRIEIYGFDTIEELKVILAHEIGHLVGAQHIDVKGALMNPIIQKEQIMKLSLTKEDIEAFNRGFFKNQD